MNKRLRFSLMVVMMVVCGTMNAQDIIWQEDWSGLAETDIKVDPNTVSFGYDYSFTGTTFKDDGSYSGGTGFYNDAFAGGNAPELLVAKNGGTFTAKVNLGGKSGETKLAWKCNNNNLSITISSQNEEIELSDANVVGNDRELTFNIPSGVSELTITFTNSKSGNCRLDNIKLYQGQGKKPAGLSWGTSSRTVTIGAEDNQFPTLSNENQVNVVFNSSNTDVATISAGGDITLIGPGKTDISAAFFGDDEFEAQTVTYTLTVKEAQDMTQYTVSQALDIINQLDEGKTTDKEYYVKGTVTEIKEMPTSDNKANFYISDGTNVLYIFKAKGLQKKDITDADYLKINDEVVVFGKLQKYKNKDGEITPEVTSGGYICELNGKTEDEGGETPVEIKTVTVAEFIAAEVSNNVWYQLTGTISGLQENDLYGNFDLTDATGTVYVYGVLSEKGGDKQLFQQLVSQYGIKNGSKITIVGNRGYYAAQDKIEVTNAYFISVDNSGAIDPQTYTVNVAEALQAAGALEDGKETIDTYIVSGYIVGDPVADRKEDGTLYGNFNFTIGDEWNSTDLLTIYHCRAFDNQPVTDETEKIIHAGDFVKLQGKLKKFVKDGVTTLELVSCFIVEVKALGDVNDDKNVNSADIQKVYALMAQGATGETNPEADINKDGRINSGDIQKIYAIMAKQ